MMASGARPGSQSHVATGRAFNFPGAVCRKRAAYLIGCIGLSNALSARVCCLSVAWRSSLQAGGCGVDGVGAAVGK